MSCLSYNILSSKAESWYCFIIANKRQSENLEICHQNIPYGEMNDTDKPSINSSVTSGDLNLLQMNM